MAKHVGICVIISDAGNGRSERVHFPGDELGPGVYNY